MAEMLRLTDRGTVRSLRTLYKAGDDGAPRTWVTRRELVDLGFAEHTYDVGRAYPWRTRLTPLGRLVVDTLIRPIPKGVPT